MEKIRNMLTRGGRAVENELGSEHANHDLNEKAAEIASQEVANEDFEADRKVPDLDLVVSKSQEFDPVTSRLVDDIIHDDYAGVHVEDDSPYPEVRAAVPSSDDFEMPQATIRGWTIGLILTTIGSAMNMYFSLHRPTITITTLVTSILAYPMGRFWARCFPNWKIFGVPLNPGPFNIKEHAVITIMANASFNSGPAYSTDILVSMNKFYNIDFGIGFALVCTLATNMIGFSMGGLIRRVVVDSPSAIWPQNLVTCTFLTNLHINENHPANGWRISRLAFFLTVFIVGFFYYWFPGYIFTALSYFSWITWIKPNNVTINQIFGSSSGLGMFPNSFAFDWNQIAGYFGSPLIPPAGTIGTIFLSMILIFWVVVPAISFTNTWYGDYLPISSSGSYDNKQQSYEVARIVDPKTLTFRKDEYEKYSPLFLSTTFAISYGLSFASILATIVHTVLFHGKEIIEQFKLKEKPDVHNRLMARYRRVPEWWFLVSFLVFFAMSIATVRAWETEMPVWALIVALLIAMFFLLPVAIIYARTNIGVGLNVVTEFIVGYMLPGKPIAMMFFKTFGYITNNQAVTFAQDMKLGHYMKISPYNLFFSQFTAAIWSCFVQIAVMRWAYGAIDGLCTDDQPSNFTCPGAKVFFNASIIWGVIGPQRQFSHGQLYYALLYFFIIGAVLPVISWLILKKYPNSIIKYLHWPVFFSGTGYIPPATPFNYTSYCLVGLFFGWWIKRKFFHWWTKYNYSLSAGLDIGLAWSLLIISLAMGLTQTDFPSWWGNNVVNGTLDTQISTNIRKRLAPGETFGPSTW
ncbi:OPT family small oligopeptide transporter [Candida parapsilosis]|uniref:OPT family small oligopeptide transporter n=2 Tax=Candida parapsilosis TaxID=5480 RepID=G8BBK5_CANPC|nr:uncharacterized protein CPAR2_800720 [Candida parapsilosis]KAF6051421.1 OPT family small oligopeptide transporter [Candida parapsilosis]KAF6053082.1 OPT family small oligopeptide transporter [Candida parapsilosis]KAF6053223.1 OPT family small oligopeptide transporter [Candida parapsilosis]KAF6064860.1 OPT family small oligopeptide transporter [Candida parapsilosis]KAI5902154.1 Sexual differentiation process protein isp4 [Candida parapsilosis]